MSALPSVATLLDRAKAIEITPRVPFLGISVSAIVGICVADRWLLHSAWLIAGVLAFGALAFVFRRSWLCLVCCLLGFAALHTIRHKENPGRLLEELVRHVPRVAEVSGVVWSDPEPLEYSRGKPGGTFQFKLNEVEIGGARFRSDAIVIATWIGKLPAYGDAVTMSGSLQALTEPRNPGQFDFGNYLRRKGVFGRVEAKYAEDCRVTGANRGNPVVALAVKSRRWMQEQLGRDLEDSPEQVALIASMVLGLRGETPDEVQDLFRQTGTLHLFAVSGLNIAMLAIIAGFVLRPWGLNHRLIALLIIPILGFYALITGLSASCVRAAIMGALILFALVAERKTSVYNSLCAAAVLILAWDTNQFFTPGFQFSFVLVLTIVAFANRIQKRVQPWGMPDPFLPRPLWGWRQHCAAFLAKLVAASLGVTFASWFGSLAFTAGYFHMFSPSAVIANMVAVPIAFLVLALGLATLLAVPISSLLANVFSNANWLCAKSLLASVKFFASLPGSHVYVELPKFAPAPALELTVLDVGEGAAIHLHNPTGDWLIDSGPVWRYTSVTLPYLRSRGVNRLDAFFITHGDAQHIGAARSLLEDLNPRQILDTTVKDRSSSRRNVHAHLAARDRGMAFLQRGDTLNLGSAKARVLFPPAGLKRSIADDNAMVLMIECEGRRILLSSDSGFGTEQWLVENEPDIRAEVLIKGQHSRDISGIGEFLDRVQPLVIVSTADDLRAPADRFAQWTKSLSEREAVLFRQDECGAVRVSIREGELRAAAFLNGQTFRTRAQ